MMTLSDFIALLGLLLAVYRWGYKAGRKSILKAKK